MGTAWFPPDATEAPIVHVAHVSIVSCKQVKVKHEGPRVARVGACSDSTSHLCVWASAADGLSPLLAAECLQPGGERKPASTVLMSSNVTNNPV